jgi:hypothetical protein
LPDKNISYPDNKKCSCDVATFPKCGGEGVKLFRVIIKLNSAETELGNDILTWSDSNLSLSLLIFFHLETFPKRGGEGVKFFRVIIKLNSAETELGNNKCLKYFPVTY